MSAEIYETGLARRVRHQAYFVSGPREVTPAGGVEREQTFEAALLHKISALRAALAGPLSHASGDVVRENAAIGEELLFGLERNVANYQSVYANLLRRKEHLIAQSCAGPEHFPKE